MRNNRIFFIFPTFLALLAAVFWLMEAATEFEPAPALVAPAGAQDWNPTSTPTPEPTATPTATPTPTPPYIANPTPIWGGNIYIDGYNISNTTQHVPYNPAHQMLSQYSSVPPTTDGVSDTDTLLPNTPLSDGCWEKPGIIPDQAVSGPGTYIVRAVAEDGNNKLTPGGPDCNNTCDAALEGKSCTIKVVTVAAIHAKIDGNWGDVTNQTIDLMQGTRLKLKAIPEPEGAWPSGYPSWQGYGSGEEIIAAFDSVGDFTVSAICGNTKQVHFRVRAPLLDYKRGSEGEDYYKTDGGGVNGEVLAGAVFDYRAFSDDDFDPMGLRWDIYDLDYLNELICGGGGNCSQAINDLGSTRVRFYCDENGDDEYTAPWLGRNEPAVSTSFEVKEKWIHLRTAKYAPTLASAPDIASHLSGASDLLIQRDDPDDYRALVELQLSGTVTPYESSFPVVVTNNAQRDAAFGVDASIIYVEEITNALGWGDFPIFFGLFQNLKIMVQAACLDATYAHEIGHNRGLGDLGRSGCCNDCTVVEETEFNLRRIMFHSGTQQPVARGILTENEANTYE